MSVYLIVFSQKPEEINPLRKVLGEVEAEERQKATIFKLTKVSDKVARKLWDILHLHELAYDVHSSEVDVSRRLNFEVLKERKDARFLEGTRVKHPIYGHGSVSSTVLLQGEVMPEGHTIVRWQDPSKRKHAIVSIEEIAIHMPDIQLGQVVREVSGAKNKVVIARNGETTKIIDLKSRMFKDIDYRDLEVSKPTVNDILDLQDCAEQIKQELNLRELTESLVSQKNGHGVVPLWKTQERKKTTLPKSKEPTLTYLRQMCPDVSQRQVNAWIERLGSKDLCELFKAQEEKLKYQASLDLALVRGIAVREIERRAEVAEVSKEYPDLEA